MFILTRTHPRPKHSEFSPFLPTSSLLGSLCPGMTTELTLGTPGRGPGELCSGPPALGNYLHQEMPLCPRSSAVGPQPQLSPSQALSLPLLRGLIHLCTALGSPTCACLQVAQQSPPPPWSPSVSPPLLSPSPVDANLSAQRLIKAWLALSLAPACSVPQKVLCPRDISMTQHLLVPPLDQ